MILDNAPQNEAVLSNVGEIGEFRIRNSAKAFSILSSGLYANKIRAVIRELSCNAVDSHTAAGKQDTPFDVHLPNTLEPFFSIRDYGVGLNHEQVINIYTTYFESTKTESNAFIGALGLGSKSPFSYTDNFTVTAIKDGKRAVYSAFINGEGVPSIALMHSEDSDQPNGVEVQFAVDTRNDFYKFEDEAMNVFTYFKLRPVVSGSNDFEFIELEYEDRNIIPGVHARKHDRYTKSSRAVMGNIAYPIDVPNEDQLGAVGSLLNCGLEMHFDIGELDFQASREGLSYIPQTIRSIKQKLEALSLQLTTHLQLEADTITNMWERAAWLHAKSNSAMWAEATRNYIINTKFPLIKYNANNSWLGTFEFAMTPETLAKKYNIAISGFTKSRNSVSCNEIKLSQTWPNGSTAPAVSHMAIPVSSNVFFVTNDLKTGAITRAKYHWRHATDLPNPKANSSAVFVLLPADKAKPMKTAAFFKELMDPPHQMLASSLLEKTRAEVESRATGERVSILRLESRERGYRSVAVWANAGTANTYVATKTYYYVPLTGFATVNPQLDPKSLHTDLARSGIARLTQLEIYGVRKGDIEFIKTQANWVDLEQHIKDTLATLTPEDLAGIAKNKVDRKVFVKYNAKLVNKITSTTSPYLLLVNKLKDAKGIDDYRSDSLVRLCNVYAPAVNVTAIEEVFVTEVNAVYNRYPMFNCVRDYDIQEDIVAGYINLIDSQG